MSRHRLRPVRPGDALSAADANLVNALLKRRVTGRDVIETSAGWHIKSRAQQTTGIEMRLVQVTGVLADRLECREVRMIDWREYEAFGDTFEAAAWPTQELSDYVGASNIVMPAFRMDDRWIVHLSGDRLMTTYPDSICEACA